MATIREQVVEKLKAIQANAKDATGKPKCDECALCKMNLCRSSVGCVSLSWTESDMRTFVSGMILRSVTLLGIEVD